jgi:ribosome-binding protein aMBF1 (putative translation factor)
MPRRHRLEKDAVDHSYDRFIGSDPERRAGYEAALARAELAMMIYEHRRAAGLTQAALARQVGTSTSVISRLESTDYEGHSMAMLRRIAMALGKKVEVRLVDVAGPEARKPKWNGRRKAVA